MFIGDYPHICRLAEAGDFDYALDCLGARRRDVAPPSCRFCNSLRFVMCPSCRGSHKAVAPPPTDEIELKCAAAAPLCPRCPAPGAAVVSPSPLVTSRRCCGCTRVRRRYYDPAYPEYVECPDCNENGMVQCECTLGSPQQHLQRLTEGESPM